MTGSRRVDELFRDELVVINVGPRTFGDAVRDQGVEVIQVDWKPATAEDQEMNDILKGLGGI